MADFNPIFEKMILLEGGYKLHKVKGDRGGMTYAGVARKRWPKWPGWIKIDANEFDSELTGLVREFYRVNFWDVIHGDEINSQEAAYHIFAFSVNAGTKTGVRMTQRVINATPDGSFGPKTLATLNDLVQDEKDARIFALTYSLFKVFRYKNICLHDDRRKQDQIESNLQFICGWINRVEKGISKWAA